MSAYTIGIDIGTGSTKSVAINANGEIMQSFSIHYPTTISENHHEQDPSEILNAFVGCIQQLTKSLGSPTAIGISSAMHSLLLCDQHTAAITPLITWADGRASDQAEDLRKQKIGVSIYENTGTPIHPMSPICKIKWFRENKEELFNKAKIFIGIKEYIWYYLFKQYEIDYSIASATGLFNIHTKEWHHESLSYLGIATDQLSKPVNTNFSRTITDIEKCKQLGINSTTKFVIGASDGCLANLGSHSIEAGIAAITIGTSGAIRIASTLPIFDNVSMPFNYLLDEKTFIVGGPINNGGAVLKWFINDILKQEEAAFSELIKETSSINAGSNGLIFLPYLTGERAPLWDADASGIFMGLRNYHSQKHLVKALMEGVCFALYSVAENLESKIPFTKIHVSGGVVRANEWLQILSDIFNKEVHLLDEADASAIGAAMMANPSLSGTRKKSHLHSYLPNQANHNRYKKLYSIYQSLYPMLKTEMQTLSQLRS